MLLVSYCPIAFIWPKNCSQMYSMFKYMFAISQKCCLNHLFPMSLCWKSATTIIKWHLKKSNPNALVVSGMCAYLKSEYLKKMTLFDRNEAETKYIIRSYLFYIPILHLFYLIKHWPFKDLMLSTWKIQDFAPRKNEYHRKLFPESIV